jgi:ribosomal protein L13E
MGDGSQLRSGGETWGPVSPDNVQQTGVSLDGQVGSPIVAAEAQQVEQLEEDLVTGPDPMFLCPSGSLLDVVRATGRAATSRRGSGFALARSEATGLCTAGDVRLLPLMIEAERRWRSLSEEEVQAELSSVEDYEPPFVRVEGRETLRTGSSRSSPAEPNVPRDLHFVRRGDGI